MPEGKLAPWLLTAGILAAFPAALNAQPTEQLPRDRVATLCWPELATLERFNRVDPIPVGCELADCCPGCPKPELITWRILLSGGPIDSAELEFENLTGRSSAAFDLGGTARQEGSKIIIGKGEAIVRGLPALPSTPEERPAVGRMLLRYDADWGAPGNARAAKEERFVPADAADAIELIVEQRLGDVVVNEYLLRYNLRYCSAHESDRIVLANNTGNHKASLLIDARTSTGLLGTCVDDLEKIGAPSINVGELTMSLMCRSELAVFSAEKQMMLVPKPRPDWTTGDDTRTIELQAPLIAPVVVWLADPAAELIAESHVVLASELFSSERAGITFDAEFRPVAQSDRAIIGNKCTPIVNPSTTGALGVLATLNSRPQDPLFIKHALNVYYVANLKLSGENCAADRNIQYIGKAAENESLAHEFGHSMGLWHSNDIDGDGIDDENVAFGGDNLMWPNTPSRCCLSLGQVFRLNAHCTSSINLNGKRDGPVRNCSSVQPSRVTCPVGTDTHCPALTVGMH